MKQKVYSDIRSQIILQDLQGSDKVHLFDYLSDQSRYSNISFDAPKLSKRHQEIYKTLAFGESLKTQVAVRYHQGIITAVLDENTVHRISGFLQLNMETRKVVFNFGPEFGSFTEKLTDAEFAKIQKKLNEIRSHYLLNQTDPFQFYYNTMAHFRMKGHWTYVVENGDLRLFMKNKNSVLHYDRENQKHRCATDLFWLIFEMMIDRRTPSQELSF